MIKNIIRYILIIALVCGGFYVINVISGDTDNNYEDVVNQSFSFDDSQYDLTLAYDGFEPVIVHRDDTTNENLFDDCYYALLIDATDETIYCSKNTYKRMYPASMTKLMTAIIVCDYMDSGMISEDDIVTVSNYYDLTYEDVLPCELKPGSKISVKDLMYGLLIESNNYYALILADYIAGSEDVFCSLMNNKAAEIGATNTHFVNPHGLDNPEHYSTAYDIYLIISEADTYEYIRNIGTYETYSYTYTNQEGYAVDADIEATNLFFNGYVSLPTNFSIRTWKTGTTSGAGNCLALCLTKNQHTYYLVASHGGSKKELYDLIVQLLCLVK